MSSEPVEICADSGSESDHSAPLLSSLLGIYQRVAKMSSGEVQVGGPAPELTTTPGIRVRGRTLPLPLDEVTATTFYQQGEVSPHGKGYDTVVDPAVRSSREYGVVR